MTRRNVYEPDYRAQKLARRNKAYDDCLARPSAWDHGRWSGSDLRQIRARKGVGRPAKVAA